MKQFKTLIGTTLVITILLSYCLTATASTMHAVKPGDSLWSIAQKYDTTTNQIKVINNHWSNKILPGDRLVIPGKFKTYVVRPGDTLFKVAHKFNTNLNKLRSINDIWSNIIYPGKVLTIPEYNEDNIDSFSKQERDLLARLIHSEARGENFIGKVAVASVILNRVESPKFPNSISGVVYQPLAFEPVMNGQIHLRPDQEAFKAAKAALKGWDPTRNALYFYNPAKVSPYNWIWSRNTIEKIGEHLFAR